MKRFVFPVGLLLLLLGGSPVHAAEAMSESSLAYRRTTLETLVAESQREKTYPRRQIPHDHPFFNSAEHPKLTELEPPGPSFGDVVGA